MDGSGGDDCGIDGCSSLLLSTIGSSEHGDCGAGSCSTIEETHIRRYFLRCCVGRGLSLLAGHTLHRLGGRILLSDVLLNDSWHVNVKDGAKLLHGCHHSSRRLPSFCGYIPHHLGGWILLPDALLDNVADIADVEGGAKLLHGCHHSSRRLPSFCGYIPHHLGGWILLPDALLDNVAGIADVEGGAKLFHSCHHGGRNLLSLCGHILALNGFDVVPDLLPGEAWVFGPKR